MRIKLLSIFSFTIFALIVILLIIKNNPKHWLIYTSKPIGTSNKKISETLFTFGGKNLFINDQAGNTYGINQKTGEILWKIKIEDYSPFAVTQLDSKNILINGFDSNLYALNFLSGIEKWRFNNPNNTHPDTPAITDDNDENIFFADRVGTLYAINKESGKNSWEHQFKPVDLSTVNLKNNLIHFGKLFQDEDSLYIKSSTESKLISINKKDGKIDWETELEYKHSDIFIRQNTIITNTNEYVFAINKNNGQVLWKMKYLTSPNKENIHEQYIYLISKHQELRKVELTTGKIIWTLNTSGEIKPEIIFNNNQGYLLHYIPGNQNNLISLNLDNGSITWEKKITSDINAHYLSKNNYLILGSANGRISILDSKQGEITEESFIGGKITKIFEEDKSIIATSISEGSHAIFTKLSPTLEKIWHFKTSYKVAPTSIHSTKDRIFFTDEGRQLIASINTRTDYDFNQNDFNFDTQVYEDKKLTTKMIEFFSHLLPNFLEESGLDKEPKTNLFNLTKEITNSFVGWITNSQQIKKNNFSINSHYDQSILKITVKHNLENIGEPLDKKIKLSAILTSPSNKKYKINGFLYQKNTWKINFRPDETGIWTYQLKLKTPFLIKNISFKKNIEITESSKIKFIKFKKSDPFNFYLEDNSKFYPLGLEDKMTDINYDRNPLNQWGLATTPKPPENMSEVEFTNFDNYLKLYADNGFNLYRWGVNNASFPLSKELSDYQKIDFGINKFGDDLVEELRNQNYHIIMTLFGFYPPSSFSIEKSENKKIVRNYLDHIISRYASHIDIWEITNEAEVSDEWLQFVINYIREIDPYQHPINTNWDKPEMKELDLLSVHWYESEHFFQTTKTTINLINQLKKFQKPILFSEMGNVNSNWDLNSATRMRVKLWTGFFNQAYFVIWNQPRTIYYNTQNANIYLGPEERIYTKVFSEFTESIESNIEPIMIDNKNWKIEVFGLKNEDKAYVYISKTERFITQTKIELPFIVKDVKWIDPKTGLTVEKNIITNNDILLPLFDLDLIGEINL